MAAKPVPRRAMAVKASRAVSVTGEPVAAPLVIIWSVLPSAAQQMVRAHSIPPAPVGLVWTLPMLSHPDRKTLHDMVAGTVVLYDPDKVLQNRSA